MRSLARTAPLSTGLLLSLALLVSSSSEALAGPSIDCAPKSGLSTCVDLDELLLRPGAGAFLSQGPASVLPTGSVSFGLSSSYLSRPLRMRADATDASSRLVPVVEHLVNTTFLWAYGLSERVELDVAAPITLQQMGEGLAGLSGLTGSEHELRGNLIRDLRAGVRVALWQPPRRGSQALQGSSLLAGASLSLPTGDARNFGGTNSFGLSPDLTFAHRRGPWLFSAEAGARLRPGRDLGDTRVGSSLRGSVGLAYDLVPRDRLLTLAAESFGLWGLRATPEQGPVGESQASAYAPAEWALTAISAPFLAGDVAFLAGGGGALPTQDGTTTLSPRYRLNFGLRFAPQGLDGDADGVLDRDDRCVASEEDRDGFEDQDGCPEPDNDKDGVLDPKDACRDSAEDFDGHEDADGCPDLDDDKDGVPDAEDACRAEAEDRDGFEDQDGCPDRDDDRDGIEDAKDLCPKGAEDLDGYKDTDGCPDPDDDADGLDDAQDACPRAAEDKDGFEDQDGCPEPDNDKDGVLDAQDRCQGAQETLDGVEDEDGCPEASPGPLARVEKGRIVLPRALTFTRGSAELAPEQRSLARTALALALAQRNVAQVFVEGFADRAGDESPKALELASKRAEAVRAVWLEAGFPADRCIAAAGDLGAKRARGSSQVEFSLRVVPGAR